MKIKWKLLFLFIMKYFFFMPLKNNSLFHQFLKKKVLSKKEKEYKGRSSKLKKDANNTIMKIYEIKYFFFDRLWTISFILHFYINFFFLFDMKIWLRIPSFTKKIHFYSFLNILIKCWVFDYIFRIFLFILW